MTSEIDELQAKIGETLDEMIPTAYDKAYIFYDGGWTVMPSFWFCYYDSETKQIIPADCLAMRKDIIIDDVASYRELLGCLMHYMMELQKLYDEILGKKWYGIAYQLNPDGQFFINFSYEKPTGSLEERRKKWCMEYLGEIPRLPKGVLKDQI